MKVMKIPNAPQAVIRPEKLRDYLLNIEHKRGKSKAAVLLSFGYVPENGRFWSMICENIIWGLK